MSGSHRLLGVLVCAAALVAGLLVGGVWQQDEAQRITFLSVGQGDCIVVVSGGQTVLVDAGPTLNAGERLVVPKLRRMGVGRIDLLLLTHPDADHVGGLPAIAKEFEISAVAMPACFREHSVVRDLRKGPLKDTMIHWVSQSSTVNLQGARLQLVAPTEEAPKSDNDGSLFVRLTMGQSSAVLSGDAPIDVEMQMLSRLPSWNADLVQAGHHGSRTSTGRGWLATLKPNWVVISCGRNNRYDHPHVSVLEAIANAGAMAARTDTEGDISFEAGHEGFIRR